MVFDNLLSHDDNKVIPPLTVLNIIRYDGMQ